MYGPAAARYVARGQFGVRPVSSPVCCRGIPVCDPGHSGGWLRAFWCVARVIPVCGPGASRCMARGIPLCGPRAVGCVDRGQSGVWPVGSPVCGPGAVRRVVRGISVSGS